MRKILFLAKFGHDFKYFQKICNYLSGRKLELDVIRNIPIFFFEFFNLLKKVPLSKDDIDFILEYELKRKDAKYGKLKFKIITLMLLISVRLYYFRYYKIFKNGGYDTICLFGGFHIMQRTAIVLARQMNICVFFFENGLLPNTTTMDAKGTNFYNSLPREFNFYNNVSIPFIKPDYAERLTFNKEELELPKRYIFCPFQDWLDTQILLHSPWIKNMEEFYEVITKIATIIPDDLYIVIKKHPNCKKCYHNLESIVNPKIIFANYNKTANLIQNAEAVLTVNSSVGIESLMFHKKVITLGNAFYSGYGFAKKANNINEVIDIIKNLDSWSVDCEMTDKFLSYIQHFYVISESWRNPSERHLEEVCKRLL